MIVLKITQQNIKTCKELEQQKVKDDICYTIGND